jgi:hypothetical protein
MPHHDVWLIRSSAFVLPWIGGVGGVLSSALSS